MTSLYDAVEDAARNKPDNVAIMPHNIKYGELIDSVNSMADSLSARVSRGISLEVKYGSNLDFVITYLALNKLGVATVPHNPYVSQETIDKHTDGYVKEGVVTLTIPSAFDNFGQSLILFSSGSTGISKAIYLSDDNLLSNCDSVSRIMFDSTETTGLVYSPLYYILGLNMQLNMMLVRGNTAVLSSPDDSQSLSELVQNHEISYVSGVPLFFKKLLEQWPANENGKSTIRYGFIGGAPWSEELMQDCDTVLGFVPAATYGLTETSPIVSFSYGAPPGSSGKFIDTIGHSISEDGELLLSGPGIAVASGDEFPIRNVGWFHTGDIVHVDDAGYLFIDGRIKELIIKGGIKVSPYEVEQYLKSQPSVVDCVVCAVPSDNYGEDIGAGIIYADAQAKISLAELNSRMRPCYVRKFESFPVLGTSGKVDRKQVKDTIVQSITK